MRALKWILVVVVVLLVLFAALWIYFANTTKLTM